MMLHKKKDGDTKLTRDVILFSTALGLLVFEVMIGGGRAPVLTALAGLLLSPAIMRIDEARKKDKAEREAKPHE